MKNKYTLKIKNKIKNRAEIEMYGDISRYDISAKSVKDLLKNEIDEKTTEIDLRLFSGGGDVFEGIAIYNILKRVDAKITVHVDGLAASIASVIMMAGDEIIMGEGSQVMIHKPWTIAMGSSADLQETIDRLDRVENEIIKIYENKTGLSRSEIENMVAAETWFNDDEAIEFGFADSKIENAAQFNIAASVKNCDWIKKKELAKTNTEFKDKINETINRFNDVLARN
jgi:ATP-dependent Clp endopeptidase proteolytic subunit ClpP